FAGLSLTQAATGYSLAASSSGTSSATTTALTVTAAPASRLVITAQPPSSVTAGLGFSVGVAAEDAFGNIDSAYSGNVNVALASNPPGDTLGGPATVRSSAGLAMFSSLSLTSATGGDTLRVTSGNLAGTTTNPLTITAAPASQLVVTAQPPSSVSAGIAFGLVVSAEDR